MRDREEDNHESYGVIGVSRVTGSPGKLFGSQLPQHGAFIQITIKRATRYHDLSHDWIHGHGRPVVEVWMSAAQYADMISAPNVGDGVPCTIREVEGTDYELPPQEERTTAEKIHDSFEDKMRAFSEHINEKTGELRKALLAKGTLKVEDRKRVAAHLEYIRREIESNLPFVQKSFQEAVEKTTTHAKAELDALVVNTLTEKGLEALKDSLTAPALPEHEEE